MKYIFPIILLFPFAIQAGKQLCINAYLGKELIIEQKNLYFYPEEIKYPSLTKTATLSIAGASATIKVIQISEESANVECTLRYMHTNTWAKLCCLFNKHEEETVTHTVTVDNNSITRNLNINPVTVYFGNPTFLQYKKSSQVIPAGKQHLAGLLLLSMYQINNESSHTVLEKKN